MSFNFVVLSAALIAHEFTLTDSDGEDPDQVGVRTLDFEQVTIFLRDNELGFLVKSLSRFFIKGHPLHSKKLRK